MGTQESEPITSQPRMIIEPWADTHVDGRIKLIDTTIYQDPEAFQREISHLGETALQSIEYSKRDERMTHVARDAAGLLHEFLVNRYDLEISYDDETERALKADDQYQALLQASKNTKSVVVKTGTMSSQLHVNPHAEKARDAFRLYRLQKYVDLVVAYRQQAAETSGSLPSAG